MAVNYISNFIKEDPTPIFNDLLIQFHKPFLKLVQEKLFEIEKSSILKTEAIILVVCFSKLYGFVDLRTIHWIQSLSPTLSWKRHTDIRPK
ncbi:hypothetical protein, partial [Salmonella sp. S146_54837]|uniref:hypothetical protein n=1 Tax=Salmonella sp. S146_54837 TaxID=2665635 RepID=UPI001CA87C84